MRGVHVAFLRGVNVGGKHSLPMTALAALFTESGCGDVRTCIQSGNVLFTAGTALARRVPALIAAGISKRFGFEAPVVTRTAADLEDPARRLPGGSPRPVPRGAPGGRSQLSMTLIDFVTDNPGRLAKAVICSEPRSRRLLSQAGSSQEVFV